MATKPIKQDLRELTEQIVKGYKPDKIILFGSFADGKSHSWSDYDLFVIKPTRERFHDRFTRVYETLSDYPSREVDILVFTPDELKVPNYFREQVLAKGQVLYEKT